MARSGEALGQGPNVVDGLQPLGITSRGGGGQGRRGKLRWTPSQIRRWQGRRRRSSCGDDETHERIWPARPRDDFREVQKAARPVPTPSRATRLPTIRAWPARARRLGAQPIAGERHEDGGGRVAQRSQVVAALEEHQPPARRRQRRRSAVTSA